MMLIINPVSFPINLGEFDCALVKILAKKVKEAAAISPYNDDSVILFSPDPDMPQYP